MPYIKHRAHHYNPKHLIEYALDKRKNPDLKYASGINCNPDVESAYDEFRRVFERYSDEKFYAYSQNKDEKHKRIRLHHYIQSFDPKENISPEKAHQLGMKWARKVWGDKRQIIISTHLDKSHIHNHFIVAAYDLDGKMWYASKNSLMMVRKISDEICIARGVSIIENTSDKGKQYNEWTEAKRGRSWKDNLREQIDKLIVDSKVTTVDDLLERLQASGCKIRRGKFISVKPPEAECAVRLFRLGDGYSEEQLAFHLEHKDKETSLASIFNRYDGISVEYALVLHQIELAVYKKRPNPKRYNYKNLLDGAELLTFISEKHIVSFEQFRRVAAAESAKTKALKTDLDELKSEQKHMQKLTSDATRYFDIYDNPDRTDADEQTARKLSYIGKFGITSREKLSKYTEKLDKLNESLAKAEATYKTQSAEDKKIAALFERYKSNLTDDYTKIFEQVREEMRDAERLRREIGEGQYARENSETIQR
jgi:hypothetical protein